MIFLFNWAGFMVACFPYAYGDATETGDFGTRAWLPSRYHHRRNHRSNSGIGIGLPIAILGIERKDV